MTLLRSGDRCPGCSRLYYDQDHDVQACMARWCITLVGGPCDGRMLRRDALRSLVILPCETAAGLRFPGVAEDCCYKVTAVDQDTHTATYTWQP